MEVGKGEGTPSGAADPEAHSPPPSTHAHPKPSPSKAGRAPVAIRPKLGFRDQVDMFTRNPAQPKATQSSLPAGDSHASEATHGGQQRGEQLSGERSPSPAHRGAWPGHRRQQSPGKGSSKRDSWSRGPSKGDDAAGQRYAQAAEASVGATGEAGPRERRDGRGAGASTGPDSRAQESREAQRASHHSRDAARGAGHEGRREGNGSGQPARPRGSPGGSDGGGDFWGDASNRDYGDDRLQVSGRRDSVPVDGDAGFGTGREWSRDCKGGSGAFGASACSPSVEHQGRWNRDTYDGRMHDRHARGMGRSGRWQAGDGDRMRRRSSDAAAEPLGEAGRCPGEAWNDHRVDSSQQCQTSEADPQGSHGGDGVAIAPLPFKEPAPRAAPAEDRPSHARSAGPSFGWSGHDGYGDSRDRDMHSWGEGRPHERRSDGYRGDFARHSDRNRDRYPRDREHSGQQSSWHRRSGQRHWEGREHSPQRQHGHGSHYGQGHGPNQGRWSHDRGGQDRGGGYWRGPGRGGRGWNQTRDYERNDRQRGSWARDGRNDERGRERRPEGDAGRERNHDRYNQHGSGHYNEGYYSSRGHAGGTHMGPSRRLTPPPGQRREYSPHSRQHTREGYLFRGSNGGPRHSSGTQPRRGSPPAHTPPPARSPPPGRSPAAVRGSPPAPTPPTGFSHPHTQQRGAHASDGLSAADVGRAAPGCEALPDPATRGPGGAAQLAGAIDDHAGPVGARSAAAATAAEQGSSRLLPIARAPGPPASPRNKGMRVQYAVPLAMKHAVNNPPLASILEFSKPAAPIGHGEHGRTPRSEAAQMVSPRGSTGAGRGGYTAGTPSASAGHPWGTTSERTPSGQTARDGPTATGSAGQVRDMEQGASPSGLEHMSALHGRPLVPPPPPPEEPAPAAPPPPMHPAPTTGAPHWQTPAALDTHGSACNDPPGVPTWRLAPPVAAPHHAASSQKDSERCAHPADLPPEYVLEGEPQLQPDPVAPEEPPEVVSREQVQGDVSALRGALFAKFNVRFSPSVFMPGRTKTTMFDCFFHKIWSNGVWRQHRKDGYSLAQAGVGPQLPLLSAPPSRSQPNKKPKPYIPPLLSEGQAPVVVPWIGLQSKGVPWYDASRDPRLSPSNAPELEAHRRQVQSRILHVQNNNSSRRNLPEEYNDINAIKMGHAEDDMPKPPGPLARVLYPLPLTSMVRPSSTYPIPLSHKARIEPLADVHASLHKFYGAFASSSKFLIRSMVVREVHAGAAGDAERGLQPTSLLVRQDGVPLLAASVEGGLDSQHDQRPITSLVSSAAACVTQARMTCVEDIAQRMELLADAKSGEAAARHVERLGSAFGRVDVYRAAGCTGAVAALRKRLAAQAFARDRVSEADARRVRQRHASVDMQYGGSQKSSEHERGAGDSNGQAGCGVTADSARPADHPAAACRAQAAESEGAAGAGGLGPKQAVTGDEPLESEAAATEAGSKEAANRSAEGAPDRTRTSPQEADAEAAAKGTAGSESAGMLERLGTLPLDCPDPPLLTDMIAVYKGLGGVGARRIILRSVSARLSQRHLPRHHRFPRILRAVDPAECRPGNAHKSALDGGPAPHMVAHVAAWLTGRAVQRDNPGRLDLLHKGKLYHALQKHIDTYKAMKAKQPDEFKRVQERWEAQAKEREMERSAAHDAAARGGTSDRERDGDHEREPRDRERDFRDRESRDREYRDREKRDRDWSGANRLDRSRDGDRNRMHGGPRPPAQFPGGHQRPPPGFLEHRAPYSAAPGWDGGPHGPPQRVPPFSGSGSYRGGPVPPPRPPPPATAPRPNHLAPPGAASHDGGSGGFRGAPHSSPRPPPVDGYNAHSNGAVGRSFDGSTGGYHWAREPPAHPPAHGAQGQPSGHAAGPSQHSNGFVRPPPGGHRGTGGRDTRPPRLPHHHHSHQNYTRPRGHAPPPGPSDSAGRAPVPPNRSAPPQNPPGTQGPNTHRGPRGGAPSPGGGLMPGRGGPFMLPPQRPSYTQPPRLAAGRPPPSSN